MIFSRLENIELEKRTSLSVGSSGFISLNPLKTFFISSSVSEVLMMKIHLNLPEYISFANGNAIEYLYNASGVKVKKKVYDLTTPPSGEIKEVDYLDGFQYAGEVLQFFPHAEGYVSATPGQSNASGIFTSYIYNYVYNYTDHLGNIRLSYSKDPVNNQLKIMEQNHYYPFGLKHQVYATSKMEYELVEGMEELARPSFVNKTSYQYKYNGKEFQDELGLGMYDYGWRNYDSALGRWLVIDQLAEVYSSISPYTYVVNNPIRYIDPDGRKIEDPDDIVKNYKNELNANKSALQGMIKDGSVGAEIGATLISFFNDTLGEITKLEKSDQVYNVFSDTSSKEGGVSYDLATGNINIGIGDTNIELVGHELKHAYQYEKGEISLVVDNSAYGQLYDITDETSSYNRGGALGSGLQYFQAPTTVINGYPLQMNDSDVRRFGTSMTPPAYQTLPSGPIDINSKEGKALRSQTRQAGSSGTPVKEVYKGWQKDYQKGQKK